MTEPPWLTKARKYVVTPEEKAMQEAGETIPPSEDRMPIWEDDKEGANQILDWGRDCGGC